MHARVIWIATVSSLALVAACATNPVSREREFTFMSEAQEISIGRESHVQIEQEMGFYNDFELQRYIEGIGLEMARRSERPDLPWHFTVVDDAAINAFAVPGGYIYMTRGILPFLQDEAELAGVVGHEIGHITARHSAQQYTRQVSGLLGITALSIFVPAAQPFGEVGAQALGVLFLRYGRDDELQADELGARYTAASNWDPAGVPGMLSTLGRLDEARGDRRGVPNWLSTHPEPLSRVAEVQPLVAELKASRGGFVTDRDDLLQRVDGLIYGDNPDEGITRGSTFLHPPLRFRIEFPAGWEVVNSSSQVAAKAPAAEVYMVLQVVEGPRGQTIEDVAANSMQGAGFRRVSGERIAINGLDAYVGAYTGRLQNLGPVRMRAAHIRHGGEVYIVGGFASEELYRQSEAAIDGSLRSFTPLTEAEAAAILPNRVDLYVVRQGDSWGSIAERSGGLIQATSLAIMNGSDPDLPPIAGTRIKIVVAG